MGDSDKDASDHKKSNEMSSNVIDMSDRQPGLDELYCIMQKQASVREMISGVFYAHFQERSSAE